MAEARSADPVATRRARACWARRGPQVLDRRGHPSARRSHPWHPGRSSTRYAAPSRRPRSGSPATGTRPGCTSTSSTASREHGAARGPSSRAGDDAATSAQTRITVLAPGDGAAARASTATASTSTTRRCASRSIIRRRASSARRRGLGVTHSFIDDGCRPTRSSSARTRRCCPWSHVLVDFPQLGASGSSTPSVTGKRGCST